MNAPERSSAFMLDEDSGEQKLVYTPDTKVTNAGTIRFNKEDHTILNLLRMQLLRDSSVRFVGYLHPHPLLNYMDLKIQTNTSHTSPTDVLSTAIEDLGDEVDQLSKELQEAIGKWKEENRDVLGN